jgi:hypothetical protein
MLSFAQPLPARAPPFVYIFGASSLPPPPPLSFFSTLLSGMLNKAEKKNKFMNPMMNS